MSKVLILNPISTVQGMKVKEPVRDIVKGTKGKIALEKGGTDGYRPDKALYGQYSTPRPKSKKESEEEEVPLLTKAN